MRCSLSVPLLLFVLAAAACISQVWACSCDGCVWTYNNITFNTQRTFPAMCSGNNFIGVQRVNVRSTDGSQFRVFTLNQTGSSQVYTNGSTLSSTACFNTPVNADAYTVIPDNSMFAVEVLCDSSNGCSVQYYVDWDCYADNNTNLPSPSTSVSLETATTYSWSTINSSCTASCTLQVTCQDGFGHAIDPAQCDSSLGEPKSEPCYDSPCVPKWNISSWSACSATCGGGVQNRNISCVAPAGNPVPSSHCPAAPATCQSCNTQGCSCDTGSACFGAGGLYSTIVVTSTEFCCPNGTPYMNLNGSSCSCSHTSNPSAICQATIPTNNAALSGQAAMLFGSVVSLGTVCVISSYQPTFDTVAVASTDNSEFRLFARNVSDVSSTTSPYMYDNGSVLASAFQVNESNVQTGGTSGA